MIIDSHCHLNFEYENKTPADLIQEALQNGVTELVTVGTEHHTFAEVKKISEDFSNVYHTVGIHPHNANSVSDEIIQDLHAYAAHPKCVAIGEIGIDYYYNHSTAEEQANGIQLQLDVALKHDLPVIIHSRDGEADLLPILQKFISKKAANAPAGVIHCFTGSYDFARACIDMGFNIGVSGIFTFKKSQELRDLFTKLPIESLVVETDAPFLAPEPHRGKKCEPYMVRNTAERLALLKNMPLEEVARITTANTKNMFYKMKA